MTSSSTPDRADGQPAAGQPATTNPSATAGGGAGRAPGRGGRTPRGIFLLGTVAVAIAVTISLSAFLVLRHTAQSTPGAGIRLSGIPAEVPTSLATLMALEPLPHTAAPGFTLTDQSGRTMSLSSLRGKVVVLEFMDPHCTDICPIVSQEFVDAYHDLGTAAGKVVFVAVNVNQYYNSTAAMAAFSREHQLTTIPSWHFFTGSVAALRTVWRGYNITVRAPNPNADIIHTSAVYFIDPQGREAFLASPAVDHTSKGTAFLPISQIASWGHGIALVARHLAG